MTGIPYKEGETIMDMKDEAFVRLAEAHELDIVWTTCGINGYPQNEDRALIGFEDWAQVEAIAKATGFDIKILRRRDGWGLWEFRGDATTALDALDYAGDGWEWYGKCKKTPLAQQEKGFIGQWWVLNDDIDNAKTCDEILAHAQLGKELWDEITMCEEGEIVLYWSETGKYERMQRRSMRLHDNDVWEYAIGLVRPAAV